MSTHVQPLVMQIIVDRDLVKVGIRHPSLRAATGMDDRPSDGPSCACSYGGTYDRVLTQLGPS